MLPAEKWLREYETQKDNIKSPIDLNKYFEESEINGQKLTVINIGKCDLPSGKIVVCDPLIELEEPDCPAFFTEAPRGTYNVEISVIDETDYDSVHYAAARIKFNDKRPVNFYEALIGDEDLEGKTTDTFFGFGVESGLVCFADKEAQIAFNKFAVDFYSRIGNDNIFDGFFNEKLMESYKNNPEFQSDDGDFAIITIPDTEYRIAVFSSGYGEGVYPVYWGYDEDGQLSQIVIHFIDIEQESAD